MAEPTASKETPYHHHHSLENENNVVVDGVHEAKIVISQTRMGKEFGYYRQLCCCCCCYCCERPFHQHELRKPKLLQQQGVPDELWKSFTSNLYQELDYLQTLYAVSVSACFLLLWGSYAFLKYNRRASSDERNNDNNGSSNNSDSEWTAVDTLICISFVMLVLLVAAAAFNWIQTVGNHYWSFLMNKLMRKLVLRWEQPFLEYGLDLSFDSSQEEGAFHCFLPPRHEKRFWFRRPSGTQSRIV